MLEDVNRLVSAAEAQRVAGLSDELFGEMRDITVRVNEVITRHASEVGLRHCDRKVEYLFSGDARMVLADSPGTPDESRRAVWSHGFARPWRRRGPTDGGHTWAV
jgi:phosphoribosylaminoimidazole-succinocarboxamide synthase